MISWSSSVNPEVQLFVNNVQVDYLDMSWRQPTGKFDQQELEVTLNHTKELVDLIDTGVPQAYRWPLITIYLAQSYFYGFAHVVESKLSDGRALIVFKVQVASTLTRKADPETAEEEETDIRAELSQ